MAKSWGLLGLLLVLFAAPAVGDDWALPAPTGFVSPGFSHVAEIFPPHSRQNPGERPLCFFYAVGYPGAAWQVDAHLVWEGPLANERMPYEALISFDGDFVTLNEYGSVGYDNAVVIYGRDDRLVKAYALQDLIPADELQSWEHDGKVALSTSSRWWNKGASYYFLAEPRRLYVVLPWKAALKIPLDGSAPEFGPAARYAELAAPGANGAVAMQVGVSSLSLRFASITDVIAARLGRP